MVPIRVSILHPDDVPSDSLYHRPASDLTEMDTVCLDIWRTEGLIEAYELRLEIDGSKFLFMKPTWRKQDCTAWQATLHVRICELENNLITLREKYTALRSAQLVFNTTNSGTCCSHCTIHHGQLCIIPLLTHY